MNHVDHQTGHDNMWGHANQLKGFGFQRDDDPVLAYDVH